MMIQGGKSGVKRGYEAKLFLTTNHEMDCRTCITRCAPDAPWPGEH